MKTFKLIFMLAWVMVFLSIIYLSIITLKKEPIEKSYKIDNAEIYY